MLFVSRYYRYSSYGVVDTDDGVEEIVSVDTIKQAVFQYGLDIKGVTSTPGSKRVRAHLLNILAYQRECDLSAAQVKLLTLSGVELTTYCGLITSLRWRNYKGREPLQIRLSDYGTEVADRIFYGNLDTQPHSITLILDDKLKLNQFSFDCNGLLNHHRVLGRYGLGVKLDIREVTDSNTVEMFYEQLFGDPFDWDNFDDMAMDVIDHEDRKESTISARKY